MVGPNERPAAFTDDSAGGTLRFSGSLSLAQLGDLPDRLAAYDGKVERLDLSGIERLDTIGAWTIHRFAQKNGADGRGAERGRPASVRPGPGRRPAGRDPRRRMSRPFQRVLGEIGDATIQAGQTLYGLLGFLGATTLGVLGVDPPPAASASTRPSSASKWSASPRSASSG